MDQSRDSAPCILVTDKQVVGKKESLPESTKSGLGKPGTQSNGVLDSESFARQVHFALSAWHQAQKPANLGPKCFDRRGKKTCSTCKARS